MINYFDFPVLYRNILNIVSTSDLEQCYYYYISRQIHNNAKTLAGMNNPGAQ